MINMNVYPHYYKYSSPGLVPAMKSSPLASASNLLGSTKDQINPARPNFTCHTTIFTISMFVGCFSLGWVTDFAAGADREQHYALHICSMIK